ncbi:flagellar hook-associated protein FlgL [Pseudodesulfovibrio sp. zrk46]|uniref:flagellar hook-associated protein FlgL n=1 Tax=Pseudodesulfovibrio sp. zrk46 TaxID=2725288 RepID=UPI001449FACF|nr:flagellar hook-associated protein FlgL [Pseudodesulfovibrio sp. zrk46]QJB57222.1 flagellar hook-associated protein FlgL [Pseudodesulfovibrio sp. zrk46]
MRISTSQIFSQSLTYMNSSLNDVAELNMMNSSQKKINSPSDDPAGMGKVMELRAYDQSLSGYIDNCSTSGDYLSLADESLVQVSENISAAMELTEQASTETYTEEQLKMMALEMESYLDSILAIANTQMGSDSIFAGDDLGNNAFEKGLGVTLTNDSLQNSDFTSMTGEIDSTVKVQFLEDGTVGTDELDYRYSTDGGETWTTATLAAGDTELDLGTAQVELVNGTAVTTADDEGNGTEFYLREAVYYTGSDEAMTVGISESTTIDMTTVGSDIFGGVDSSTSQPYEDPNLFETLSDAIVYMEIGDYDAVAACLDDLTAAHENVETGAANIGARENKVTYTQQSLSQVQEITTTSISREEDADAAQILVELEQANYVYEAVLNSSADIMNMSLLDYV